MWSNPHDAKNQLTPEEWAPDGLTIEPINIYTAKVTWNQIEQNVDGFQIDKRVGDNAWVENFQKVEMGEATEYSITDADIIPDTNLVHQYRVTTYAENEKSFSIANSITPEFPKPSELQLEQLSIDQINLTWKDNSDGEDGFKIDRKIGSNDWEVVFATVGPNTTTYFDNNAVPNETNLYRVYAYKSDNHSAQIQSSQTIYFPSPTDLEIEQLTLAKIKLTWKENIIGEEGFVIDRKYEDNDWEENYTTVDKDITTFTDESTLPSANYRYRIYAFNNEQKSSSQEIAISTEYPAPSDLSNNYISDKEIILSWVDNSEDEEGFKIDRKVGSEGEWVQNYGSVAGDITTWTDENPGYGETNYYVVYSFINDKKSDKLNTSVLNIIEAPTSLTTELIDDENIQLSWEDNCHFESNYVIERSSGSGYAEIIKIAENNTTYTDNTVAYNTKYQYRVKATTDNNNSEYSNESSNIKVIISDPYEAYIEEINQFSLTLHWEDTCHFESGFKIERSDDGATFVEVGSVGPNVTEFTESGLTNDFQYNYRIFSFTENNKSNYTERLPILLAPAGLRYVQGGAYMMGDIWHEGDKDEQTLRNVTLPDFFIGTYEVSYEDYINFMNSVSITPEGNLNENSLVDMYDSDCAVEWDNVEFYFQKKSKTESKKSAMMEVTWFGAVEYCNWLSLQHGLQQVYEIYPDSVVADWDAKGYRLPTEAEWEYAARSGGGNDQKYSGTNFTEEIEEYAVIHYNSNFVVNEVGSLKPNLLGIFDMSGNVFEWCWDWHEHYLTTNPYFPTGPETGTKRVNRGGSYNFGPRYARTSNRNMNSPEYSFDYIGFRICRTR